jgi:DnaJ-like protein
LSSKYFDSIRIAPQKAKTEKKKAVRKCEWAGCEGEAPHRAPKGRNMEGQFSWFCKDHIRDYNKNYNFFANMSEEDVRGYQQENRTGHRPTWKMGMNPGGTGGTGFKADPAFKDTHGFFGENDPYEGKKDGAPARPPRNAERKALLALGLDERATLHDIKTRYKELVKKFHPDTNGGDRTTEDRLQKVIQAHDYLKKSGFC